MKFDWNSDIFIEGYVFKNIVCKISAIVSSPQCVNWLIFWPLTGVVKPEGQIQQWDHRAGVHRPGSLQSSQSAEWRAQVPSGRVCGDEEKGRCYNMVNFLPYPHNRHTIAHLWGRAMGIFCECKLWLMFYLSHCSARCTIITWLCGFWRERRSIFPWQRA